MKTLKYITVLCGFLPLLMPADAFAQVSKKVEVTKTYEPTVSESMKLPIVPDMTDTVKMRPEIEYGISPSMYATDLSTTRFKPASVTYWEFNRPTSFYVKLGTGYPINTVADFYASMHDVRTGYIMAAANHYGQFGRLANCDGELRNATQAKTKAMVAGGVYWGKHMFEGEVAYRSDVERRYALPTAVDDMTAEFEDFGIRMRLGDDFIDLSRLNFNVDIHGDFFHDKSDFLNADPKLQQFDAGVSARIARAFGQHSINFGVGYDGYWGTKALKPYRDNVAAAGLRYGFKSAVVDLALGADYYLDKLALRTKTSHYVIPYAKLVLNVTRNDSVTPFLEIDGAHRNNSYQSLAVEMPYVGFGDDMLGLPNTVDYNLRFGIGGKFGRGRFGYRLYVGGTMTKNALYWYSVDYAWMYAMSGSRKMFSMNVELDYRPVSGLTLAAAVHGRLYSNDMSLAMDAGNNGISPLDASFNIRYKHRRFAAGAYVKAWMPSYWNVMQTETGKFESYTVRAGADIGVDVEYFIKTGYSIFLAGTNLANAKIYGVPYYREQGVRCTAGVKFSF